MNECNEMFLKKNGIVVEDICSKVDCHIYDRMEINPIAATYYFEKAKKQKMVRIADVVGYDNNIGDKNIFSSLDHFFNEKGMGYNARSLSLLQLNKDNVIEALKESCIKDPMRLTETGEDNYTILGNGLHRYTMLRLFYLTEVAQAKGNEEELARIEEKYTIPALVTEVDLEKTYCKYILLRTQFDDNNWQVMDIQTEYNSNHEVTGNVILEYENGVTEVLTHKELMELTGERLLEDENLQNNYKTFGKTYYEQTSFEKFIDRNFPDVAPLEKQQPNERGER